MPPPRFSSREGFRVGRLVMVISSISPLFILWAVKGVAIIPDIVLIPTCIAIVVSSCGFVLLRVQVAKKRRDMRLMKVGTVANYDYHALTYIFAMLLPFYRKDISTGRELAAILIAILFIIIIFWYLNLHYMNIIFIFGRYKTYLIHPPAELNPLGGRIPFVLVTRRTDIASGEEVTGYRITDSVYLEGIP